MTMTKRRASGLTPVRGSGPVTACPICGTTHNRVAIVEPGIEHRFGMPVLPVSDYVQEVCRNCGLLYVNEHVDSDYLVALYSQESVRWQKEYVGPRNAVLQNSGTTTDDVRRFERAVALVARFRNPRGVQWLDFGCQTGELGDICRRKYSARMSGVEVSGDYAARAETLWGEESAIRTSISDFLREGRRFEVISALETLEHLAEPWQTVESFREALSPDGLLVVSVPSAQYFRLKYHVFRTFRQVFSRRVMRDRPTSTGMSILGLCHTHIFNFSPKSLSALLEKGGMSTVYVGGIGWSRRLWYLEAIARLIAVVTLGRVQLYPSVIAVAKRRG